MVLRPLVEIKEISASQTWPIRHKAMWPNLPFDFIKLPEDSDGTHFGLFANGELVSVVSLFRTDIGVSQFRKLATKANEQEKGYGSKLLSHLIEFAKKQSYQTLWCNARVDKTSFYERFGMLKTQRTYIKEHIEFVRLKKTL